MPDKVLTGSEIKKALECCKSNCDCHGCFLRKEEYCVNVLKNLALDLISRQEAENSKLQEKNLNLTSDLTSLQKDLTSAKAEIERLQKENHCFADIGKMYSEIKAEAVKEFAERLKSVYTNDKTYDRPNAHTMIAVLFYNINKLLKEMVGEQRKEDEGK